MITAYDYILKHWRDYDLTDTEADFIALLNILEAHGENIDSLHNAVINGHEFFCDYWLRDVYTDREAVNVIFNFNTFLSVEELKGLLYESLAELRADDDNTREEQDEIFRDEFCDDGNADSIITKTRDGYVHSVRY